MNGKERAKLAFAHKEADRVPLFELTIDNPTAAHVLGRETLCGFGGQARGVKQNRALINGQFKQYHEQRATDHLDLWRALDLDVFPICDPIPVNPLVPEQVDELNWRFEDSNGVWGVSRYAPESDTYDQVDSSLRHGGLEELERVTAIMEASEPHLEDWDFSIVDRILADPSSLGARFGGERMILGSADVQIGSTWDWAETFLIGLVQAPDLIERYLDVQLKTALMLGEALLQRGVDGLHGGYDWAASRAPMFSPRHFRKFVFPRLKQITDLCHHYGAVYVKHTDGNVNSLLDGMIESGVDAFQAIEPRASMDIAAIKQQYGDRLTLIGNVDCSTVLVNGPVEAVKEETKRIIHAAAPGGGFLLSTSNSVHPGVVPEYYLAMLETAREMGSYPIQWERP